MSLINYVTQIYLEYGAIEKIVGECDRNGICRPLIVTDKGIVAAGLVERVLARGLASRVCAVFDDTPPNPNEAAVRAAVELYRRSEADGIIAIGGGSSIDLAKGVAVCATHEGPLKQFAVVEGGLHRITASTARVIAVPTTAGTGSEVGRGAILILDDGRKVGVISPYVVPCSAICDPDMTVGLPPHLTAATGMDAIAHCIETFLSPMFNPPADGIALDGLWRAWRYIAHAVANGDDRTARLNMMSASLQGALAFQKGLGCVHSLSHSLGGINPKLHHGTLNAIFLPAVIRFNRDAQTVVDEEKISRLAKAMGLTDDSSVEAQIAAQTEALGLPTRLSQLGVTQALFPKIIDGALADHSHKTNPQIASRDDYLRIIEQSM
ncbi:iron-containing alcohol dehydrogenase [Paraburkholderia caribensis]|uniref:iron-containing alcohol dehydrogenase n=1 Tax=Paraburkholderia TaxID=1822464 RepID=UPI001CB5377F|nr:iron-containing alcohol dehydrogenase [Paraburkholderia caribensis]BEU25725.1 iron-containing alcohol dehydrogenase [Paraburkholderia sp. 22B1P]CAG9249574.1 Iron-containing alcohol dehydrogenase [Paraburkholderia caribensis]